MVDLFPPPSFTTIRINYGTSAQDGKQMLDKFIAEDIEFRGLLLADSADVIAESHPVLPDLLLVPVRKNENISMLEDEVIVDLSCGLAVLRGAHVFKPGIIAFPSRLKKGDPVSVFVDLEKKCLKGSLSFDGRKFFIGTGVMQVSRDDIFSSKTGKTSGVGVKMLAPLFLTPCLDLAILPKVFFPQNLPSVVVSHVMNPSENSIILDMCAAPGGKSTHLCSIMKNTGKVIALDRSLAKVQRIKDNAVRLGCSNRIFAYPADSRKIVSHNAVGISVRCENDFSPPYCPRSFSYILLDAPCSALGQRPKFSCNSDVKSSLSSYPSLQLQLFKSAVTLLSIGGVLVYSTCTTTFDENEGMVQRILQEYPCLVLREQNPHIGNPGREGASSLDSENLKKLQYFYPSPVERSASHPADNDTIGFFIAKFEKVTA